MLTQHELSLESLVNGKGTIGIVAHDAGGASILNALTKRFSNTSFILYIDGPAVKIFSSKNVRLCADESLFYSSVDYIILGTGATAFEKKALRKAKAMGLGTAVVLDHFTNYKSRFIYENKLIFPDICFVCDDYSYELAINELSPFSNIYLCENYLVSDLRLQLESVDDFEKRDVLYVLENINENWDEKLAPWEVAFNNFHHNFYNHGSFDQIIVRPHPKDDPELYRWLHNYPKITFDYNVSPIDSLSRVSTVVGVESYFLYLAHHCGYDVFTSLPVEIRQPRLPLHVFKQFGD